MAKKNPSAPASSNPSDYVIATMGSHSALQILHGARQEGMRNLVVCKKGSERPYTSYGVADEILEIPEWSAWESIEDELIRRNAIVIPHGSFIAYMGHKRVQNMRPPSWIEIVGQEFGFTVTGKPTVEEAALGVDIRAVVEMFAR